MPGIPLNAAKYVLIWKISSFLIRPTSPAKPSGAKTMTCHSTVFEVERPVPVNDIVKDLQPETHNQSSTDDSAPAAAPGKGFNFRKVLMAGAGLAGLSGAA